MGQIFRRTAGCDDSGAGRIRVLRMHSSAREAADAATGRGCTGAEPPKSVMFDSDPNGDWNIFPDPTTGDVGVYHKGQYLGSVDGNEGEDPPQPHPKAQPKSDDDPPDGYR